MTTGTLACVKGKERMRAKAQKESIVSIARARSVATTVSTSGTAETGGTAAGLNAGGNESGSVGIVRLGSIADATPEETGGKGRTAEGFGSAESGSVGIVRLGSVAMSNTETGLETTETVAAAAATTAATTGSGGSDTRGRGGIAVLDSSPKNVAETEVIATEETGGSTIGGERGSNNNNHTTAEKAGIVVGKGGGSIQGGQARLVRLGSFARSNTRIGRVDWKLRRSQRHRRKAHHHLMSLTYSGLRPGIDYHIRVAGISSVGQVSRTVLGFLVLSSSAHA